METAATIEKAFVEQVYKFVRDYAIRECPEVLRAPVDYQLATCTKTKGQRVAMVKVASSLRAPELLPSEVLMRAASVALVHEASLIADDIIDRSEKRRGQPAVWVEFTDLQAACAAAELNVMAEALIDHDAEARRALRQLLRDVAEAEALQEQLCNENADLERWKLIAEGDTGAMFAYALAMGGLEPASCGWLDAYTYLRHGLDDVEDELEGDGADERQGVLTLQRALGGRDKALDYLQGFLVRSMPSNPFDPFFIEMAVLWKRLSELSANVEKSS